MNPVLVLLTFVVTVVAQESLTLKYASLVFRHGDRSPVGTYPNDPYNRTSWPQGYGQLSWNGTQQHYQLGRLIRKRYTVEHQLISANYTRDEVYVRSTDYDRTLMSALSQLGGLFPPEDDQKLNRTIDWQPIPVHTLPRDDDNLLVPHGMPCPRYDQLLDENTQTDYYKQVNEEHEQFFRNVEKETGVESLDVRSIWRIADTVFVEQQWGRNPGEWVTDAVSKTLRNLTNIDFALMYKMNSALEKQRLTSGNLVGQIVERMKTKTLNNDTLLLPGTNLVLYSAHDTTVAAFLSALKIFDDKQPPYAATVFVELYSNSNSKYYVKLWYLNQHPINGFNLTNTTSSLMPMQIPNCSELCPLENFIKLTADVIPSDWEKECETSNNSNDDNAIIITVVCGILAVLLSMILILSIVYICRRRRRYEQIRQIQ